MSAEAKTRIVWIEDSEQWRSVYTPVFQRGFQRDGVSFESRPDFTELRAELQEGLLSRAYILDNEIAGESLGGAQMAVKIHERATELRKNVLVITMLCSNPQWVVNHYGLDFEKIGIPVFDKVSHPMICGFYIGRCIREGVNVSLHDWVQEQGMVLPRNSMTVNDHLTAGIRRLPEGGGFYHDISKLVALHPESFVLAYQDSEEQMCTDMRRAFPDLPAH